MKDNQKQLTGKPEEKPTRAFLPQTGLPVLKQGGNMTNKESSVLEGQLHICCPDYHITDIDNSTLEVLVKETKMNYAEGTAVVKTGKVNYWCQECDKIYTLWERHANAD